MATSTELEVTTTAGDSGSKRELGRKFKLAVWFELTCIGLLLYGKIDAVQFIDLSKWCPGGYFGANVMHRAVEAVAGYFTTRKEEQA